MLADNLSSSVVFDVVTGDLETAQAGAAEALAISRAISNTWGIGFSQMGVAIAYWMQGEFDRALEALEITITYGERSGFMIGPLWARAQMATIYGRLGHPQRALEFIAETHARTPKMSAAMPAIGVLYGHLLLAYLAAGALDEAEQLLAQVPDMRLGPGLAHELMDWGRAGLLVARGRYAEAEAQAQAMLERMQAANTLLLMAELGLCLGRAYRGQGRRAEARAALLQARAEAEARQLRWTGWQIEAELAALAEADGRTADAAEARARAGALLEYIAAHVSDGALRAGLLARRDVKAVVDGT
jgi:tetratricopeptide (TPR) repeat protein